MALILGEVKINFASTVFEDSRLSQQGELASSMIFQLGSFSNGFIPTKQNTESWRDHWTPLETTNYNKDNSIFTKVAVLEDNAAPFSVGNQAYIWGIQESPSDTEWILLSAENWVWPEVRENDISPGMISWFVKNADEIILGSVNEGAFHMVTEPVEQSPAFILSYDTWARAFFTEEELADAELTLADADPDNDGKPNLLEYAYGSDPKSADYQNPLSISINQNAGGSDVELSLWQSSSALLSWDVLCSDNLDSWQNITEDVECLSIDCNENTFTHATPAQAKRQFYTLAPIYIGQE